MRHTTEKKVTFPMIDNMNAHTTLRVMFLFRN